MFSARTSFMVVCFRDYHGGRRGRGGSIPKLQDSSSVSSVSSVVESYSDTLLSVNPLPGGRICSQHQPASLPLNRAGEGDRFTRCLKRLCANRLTGWSGQKQ